MHLQRYYHQVQHIVAQAVLDQGKWIDAVKLYIEHCKYLYPELLSSVKTPHLHLTQNSTT